MDKTLMLILLDEVIEELEKTEENLIISHIIN